MRPEINAIVEILETAKGKVPSYMKDWKDHGPSHAHLLELDLGDEKRLSEWLGVGRDVFPAVDTLEDREVELLVEKIQDLWGAYHFFADLLPQLTVRQSYDALLDCWKEIVPMYATGEFHFDFYELAMELEESTTPV